MNHPDTKKENTKRVTFSYALLTILISLVLPIVAGAVFGLSLAVVFSLAWVVAIVMCLRCGFTYQELESGLYSLMAKGLLVITFMMIIGGMSGAWNSSGTIATVTYYGLGIFSPKFYSLTAFIICLIFSLVTGTSWGTCGTIGVALVGIGLGLGLDTVSAAAPILTAAFVGDMCSPLSDTPNIIAAATDVNVMDHCRYQLRIVIPGVVILSVIYLFTGLSSSSLASVEEIAALREAIAATYHIGIIPLLPLVAVVILLATKRPTIPTILVGTICAMLVACLYQGVSLPESVTSVWTGNVLNSGNAMLDSLFSRGGMTSMSETILLVFAAFGLFGILTTAGIFTTFLAPLTKRINSELAASFLAMGIALLLTTGGLVSVSVITTGEIMGKFYKEKGYNLYNLAMILSVCSMMFCIVMPWHANAIVPAQNLGCELADMVPHMYLPWIFLVLLIVSIFISTRKKKSAEKVA